MKFKKAYEKLQDIYNQLQSEELIDVEQIVKLQEEAEKLYNTCKDILSKQTEKVEEKEKSKNEEDK